MKLTERRLFLKFTRIAVLAATGLLAFGCAANRKTVTPGGEYTNKTYDRIYLILPLDRGQTFKNTGTDTFAVLETQQDLFAFQQRLRLEYLIHEQQAAAAKAQAKLRTIAAQIDTLQRKRESVNRRQ